MLNIATNQLYHKITKQDNIPLCISVDPTNIEELIKIMNKNEEKKVTIYDYTTTNKIKSKQLISVKDHINNTGSNILLGKQKLLNIDFIDMSNIYTYDIKNIIATCIGENNIEADYPCSFLCNISTLARALNYTLIKAYLYKP